MHYQRNGNALPPPNRLWRDVAAFGAAALGIFGLAIVAESRSDPPPACYYAELAPIEGLTGPENVAENIPGVDKDNVERVTSFIIEKTHANEDMLDDDQFLAPTEVFCPDSTTNP